MPPVRLEVVIVSCTGAITIEKFADVLCAGLPASVTMAVTVNVPADVGVPASVPVDVNVNPPGKIPVAMLQVYPGVPPLACSVCE